MNIFWAQPLFLYLMILAPALVVFYVWFRRGRRVPVSALFLWGQGVLNPERGRKLQWRRLPLEFFLELLILLLLLAALASPYMPDRAEELPMAIILDNSYSMNGGDSDSARQLGAQRLKALLKKNQGRRIIWVTAGGVPILQADSSDVVEWEKFWTVDEGAADIAGALEIARGRVSNAEILIISDHEPKMALSPEIGWWAPGKNNQDNIGIVNSRVKGDMALFEIANYSELPGEVRLKLGSKQELLTLTPGETRRVRMSLPPGRSRLELEVISGRDTLNFDNQQELIAEDNEPVGYELAEDLPPGVRIDVERVLRNNPDYVPSNNSDSELIIGGLSVVERPDLHGLIFYPPGEQLIRPEQILKLDYPALTRGLECDGVRWAATPEVLLPGRGLLRAGTLDVITLQPVGNNRNHIYWNLVANYSNISKRPFWPVWFWNMAEFVRSCRPGPTQRNLNSDTECRINSTPGIADGALKITSGERVWDLQLSDGMVLWRPNQAGYYQIAQGNKNYEVYVNVFSAREGDLRDNANMIRNPIYRSDGGERPIYKLYWVFLLGAMVVLAVHQWVLGADRRRSL